MAESDNSSDTLSAQEFRAHTRALWRIRSARKRARQRGEIMEEEYVLMVVVNYMFD